MPQKDKEQSSRDRKKNKKDNDKSGIYSSRHIRILENRAEKNKNLKK